MSTHQRVGRRLAASLGVAALGLVGVVGVANADDTTGAGNIDPNQQASLTIHKYDGDTGEAGDGTEIEDTSELGNFLPGVEFTITPVTARGNQSLAVTDPAAWDIISDATASDVTAVNGYVFGTPVVVTTGNDGSATTDLSQGLYLVTETGYGDNTITTPVVPFLVTLPLPQSNGTWLYDVHVYPKNQVSTDVPTKTVADPTGGVTIGSTVPWIISAPVQPDKPGDITSFKITDKLDERLSFVSANVAGFTLDTDYELSVVGQDVTIEFTVAGAAKLTAGDVVTIMLNTKVESLGTGVIPNQATVFTNDNGGKTTSKPGDPGTNPTTNWGPLEVLKYAAGDKEKTLAGAEFTVYSDIDATNAVGTITTGADGKGSIVLWVGNDTDKTETYYLQESKAPAGYVLDPQVRSVVINAGDAASVVVQQIANTQQGHPSLPLTGADGQLLALIGGGALLLLAGGTALVARKRRHQH